MSIILPPKRPHRSLERLKAVLAFYKQSINVPVIVFVRGYYLDTMGKPGTDDLNIYDDACFLIGNDFKLFESYNANTNPSFMRRGGRALAQLNLGKYRFYRGMHKNKYPALRAYPEGVTLPVTREGKLSTGQYINIHKGSTNYRANDIVWSEGCLTLPDTQYGDFRQRVWAEMDRVHADTIDVILLENRQTKSGQQFFDGQGNVVA